MKTIIFGLVLIIAAIAAQVYFIGLNGLTILTIFMTMYLGFEGIDKALKRAKKQGKENI